MDVRSGSGGQSCPQLSSTVIWFWAKFRTTVPNPVPGEPLGGFSPRPVRKASKVVWAEAIPEETARVSASATRRFFIILLVFSCAGHNWLIGKRNKYPSRAGLSIDLFNM